MKAYILSFLGFVLLLVLALIARWLLSDDDDEPTLIEPTVTTTTHTATTMPVETTVPATTVPATTSTTTTTIPEATVPAPMPVEPQFTG